jgi:hypothetical protein
MLESESFQGNFHLPLSEEAYEQFCELEIYVQSMEMSGEKDSRSYIFGDQKPILLQKHISTC